MPLLMKVFAPFSSHPPGVRVALVRTPRRSLPAPGSVIAIAATSSPDVMPGTQRPSCSGVASSAKYGPQTSLWTVNPGPVAPAW